MPKLALSSRKRAIEVYEPVLQLLNEANDADSRSASTASMTPIGKQMITLLRVAKVY